MPTKGRTAIVSCCWALRPARDRSLNLYDDPRARRRAAGRLMDAQVMSACAVTCSVLVRRGGRGRARRPAGAASTHHQSGSRLVCWVGSMPTTAVDWANLFGLTVFVAGLTVAVLQALGPVR